MRSKSLRNIQGSVPCQKIPNLNEIELSLRNELLAGITSDENESPDNVTNITL